MASGPSSSGEPPPSQSPPSDQPPPPPLPASSSSSSASQQLSRYESQKRRDWNTFLQFLKNHKPPLPLSLCDGGHIVEFLKYLDQFGKTKVHDAGCAYFGHPNPPAPCGCPLRQAWGSLDALIGRLRAAYGESDGKPEMNPFGAGALRMYLKEVRESQAKARGIPYEKKRKRQAPPAASPGSREAVVGERKRQAPPAAAGLDTNTTTAATANAVTSASAGEKAASAKDSSAS